MASEPLPDGDGGHIYTSETTGPKGRRRICLSSNPDQPCALRIGPQAALQLSERLLEFAYRRPAGRGGDPSPGERPLNQGKSD